ARARRPRRRALAAKSRVRGQTTEPWAAPERKQWHRHRPAPAGPLPALHVLAAARGLPGARALARGVSLAGSRRDFQAVAVGVDDDALAHVRADRLDRPGLDAPLTRRREERVEVLNDQRVLRPARRP